MKLPWIVEEYNQSEGTYVSLGEFPSKAEAVRVAREKLEAIWRQNPYKEERDELFLVAPDGSKERVRGPIVLGPIKIGQFHTQSEARFWFALSVILLLGGLLFFDSVTIQVVGIIELKPQFVDMMRTPMILMGIAMEFVGLIGLYITSRDL